MKKLIYIFVALGTLGAASTAMAKETLYLLTAAKPGGTYEAINLDAAEILGSQYDTKVVYYNDCASAYGWAKSHPDKKSLVTYSSWYNVMDSIDKSKSKCNIELSPKTFTGWIGERYDYICTYNKDLTAETFLTVPGKISVMANPVATAIAQGQMNDLGISMKVIPYKGFKKITGAAKSGETDYLIINSTSKVIANGGKCLLTAAPASNTDDENKGLVRFEDIIKNPTLQHTRVQFGLAAFNIDASKVKDALNAAYQTDDRAFSRLKSRKYTVTIGRNTEKQIEELKALSATIANTVNK